MENKNGRGIFLGVVSVATLVVAIIGATFAFFSASVTSNTGDISGNTLDISSTALSLEVTPVSITGATLTGDRHNLVPAIIEDTVAGYTNAVVTKSCEDAGYTGCHLYQIKVTAANAVEAADLYAALDLSPSANSDANWKYGIYQSASIHEAGYTPSATVGTAQYFTADNTGSGYNFYHATTNALAQGDTYFYLIVYLENITASQNGGTEGGENAEDATGSYTGTITLTAAGGQVKASFATS